MPSSTDTPTHDFKLPTREWAMVGPPSTPTPYSPYILRAGVWWQVDGERGYRASSEDVRYMMQTYGFRILSMGVPRVEPEGVPIPPDSQPDDVFEAEEDDFDDLLDD